MDKKVERAKYNLNYHVSPETVDRCALNIFEFVSEVAEPWFVKWRNLTLLAFSDESPRREPARGALIKAMKTN